MGRMVTNPATRKMPLFLILSLWQRQVRTRITVVRVPAQIGKAVLLCIGFKDTLLIGNGIALALQLVLMGKSWVKGGNWLLVGLS